MKRILFVDDESRVLQGLRRLLYPMRGEWEMEFVDSGAGAIAALQASPFDVVVTDMRMPGMDGAQLLARVREEFPHIVRIVLSGHWDESLTMQSVTTAHQYLVKPCDAERLRTALVRVFSLREMLVDPALKSLVAGLTTLPSLPSVYRDLMALLQRDDASPRAVGETLARDLGMTTKVLQLVNSAFFGLQRKVTRPEEAALLLGTDTIKSLALCMSVFAEFRARLNRFSIESLRQHSLATAMIAQRISLEHGVSRKQGDDILLAGLLHDVGKLVLAANFSARYDEMIGEARSRSISDTEAERETFGAGHAEIGVYLLWLWGLPDAVIEPIAFHHRPSEFPVAGFSAPAVIYAADFLAHEAIPGPPGPPHDQAFLERHGLSGFLPRWREIAAEAARDVPALAS